MLTRKESLQQGITFYTSQNPCKKCGTKIRYSKTGQCRTCHAVWLREYSKQNRQSINEQSRSRWKTDNKRKQRQREWQNNNREKCRQASREWSNKNPINNLERVNRRRAIKKQACPKWVDKLQLKAFYLIAKHLTNTTGISYHVDHIVPLSNALVCGLHVPWNLQVIEATENIRKGNTFK